MNIDDYRIIESRGCFKINVLCSGVEWKHLYGTPLLLTRLEAESYIDKLKGARSREKRFHSNATRSSGSTN